jgi:hypothetical protein
MISRRVFPSVEDLGGTAEAVEDLPSIPLFRTAIKSMGKSCAILLLDYAIVGMLSLPFNCAKDQRRA